jgi:AbrB family looped-hinge helix DNA binding protein
MALVPSISSFAPPQRGCVKLLTARSSVARQPLGEPLRKLFIIGKTLLTRFAMDIAITRMSSKGQVVIPAEMRRDIRAGEKLVVVREGSHLLMRKASELDEQLVEDLEFARRTEEALQRYEKGEFREMSAEEFKRELARWCE